MTFETWWKFRTEGLQEPHKDAEWLAKQAWNLQENKIQEILSFTLDVLHKISDTDFRGNRSQESIIAYEALQKLKTLQGGK